MRQTGTSQIMNNKNMRYIFRIVASLYLCYLAYQIWQSSFINGELTGANRYIALAAVIIFPASALGFIISSIIGIRKDRLEQASGAEEAAEPETAETEVPETVYQTAGGREPEDDIQDTAEELSAAAEDPSGEDAFSADSLPETADAYPEEDALLPEDGAPVIEPFVNKNVEKF